MCACVHVCVPACARACFILFGKKEEQVLAELSDERITHSVAIIIQLSNCLHA